MTDLATIGLPIILLVTVAILLVLSVVGLLRLAALARVRDDEAREISRASADARARSDALGTQIARVESDIRQDLAIARSEQANTAAGLRGEVGGAIGKFREETQTQLTDMATLQHRQLQGFGEQLAKLMQSNEERLEKVRLSVEQRLDALRADNTAKLDQMRATVDEKLQATLEQRLGESFKIVSDRLEQVHRGLGEMQSLAVGVGDLKRVMTNVKMRGGWGEVQLAALLGEMLTPQQYEANVATRPRSDNRVEFAIRLPGKGDDGAPCWLPIDAKFPLEDWQRLQEALEAADAPAADASRKALADVLRGEAKTIREKYVEPPYTTDFAILFVPTEGLYAEMMSRPGFADGLQRDFRVLITGPMNLAALLNSLQMGFRTLAIEKRSSEVWQVLGAVKSEFAKFGDVIAKTMDKLDQASKELDKTGVRSRAIERELRNVESLSESESTRILGGGANLLLDLVDRPPEDK